MDSPRADTGDLRQFLEDTVFRKATQPLFGKPPVGKVRGELEHGFRLSPRQADVAQGLFIEGGDFLGAGNVPAEFPGELLESANWNGEIRSSSTYLLLPELKTL